MQNHRQFTPAHTKTRYLRAALIVFFFAIVFVVPVLRNGVRTGIGLIGTEIARGAGKTGVFFSSIVTSIRSKESLADENAKLIDQVNTLMTRSIERDTLARQNADLERAMGRSSTLAFTLAAVIEKPPHSLYDTLLIDGGSEAGFSSGQIVYANGETPIGTIASVLPNSAIVRLYSAPGEQTDARLSPSNIDVTLVGSGGGDFSATIPHSVPVIDGETVVTKELNPSIIAVYRKITSDARDPFQTLLFAAPVNINELAFVEVKE